jgi:UrcA family protein
MNHFISAGSAGTRVKVSLLLLGSLAGVLAVGTASAAEENAPSIAVKYTQQSLATDGGVQDLYRRITLAARNVCPDLSVRDLSAQREVEQCRDTAVARAIRQIDNSRLAALYATRSKNG